MQDATLAETMFLETAADDTTPIAEEKQDAKPPRAPLRLMTQFLRAVSESRMEDALALAQTILTFEPRNAIILDYQGTLVQYINNERELAAAEEDEDESSTGEEASSTSLEGEEESDASTEDASGEDTSGGEQGNVVAGSSDCGTACSAKRVLAQDPTKDEREIQRLKGMLRDLRDRRTAASEESESRWDEDKFAASRRKAKLTSSTHSSAGTNS